MIYYATSALLILGLSIIVLKPQLLFKIIGIELMVLSSIINFIYIDSTQLNGLDGQIFSLFILAITVCEVIVLSAMIIGFSKKT